MLRDYIKAHLSFNRSKSEPHSRSPFRAVTIDPSTLSTIGLRRATEGHAVLLQNDTGIDFLISASESDQSYYDLNCDIHIDQLVEAGTQQALIASITSDRNSGLPSGFIPKLKLQLTPSAASQIGDREPLIDLPIFSADGQCISLHRLQPTFGKDRNEPLRVPVPGRCSPDTVLSENSRLTQAEYAYYNAEPVVEWCMQNQRLRTNVADSYSLPKGRDLLSSQIWSPGDDRIVDIDQGLFVEAIGHSESTDDTESLALPRKAKAITIRPSQQSNWVKPYLKNDSPEWTDMTCILRMARERVMLPDNNWIWLNDWTVDVSGAYGESTDCEGWEYEADFETFNRNRRFYKRGDSCRRRRWTRTRMIRPPPLSDPQRPIFLVWETSRNNSDNFVIQVRSHVTLHNYTTVDFAVFVSSPSWDESGLGMMNAGLSFPLPIKYANATYVQLGIPRDSRSKRYPSQKKNLSLSRRFMIVPTGSTSSNWIRTVINVRRTVGSEVFMGLDVDRNVHVIIEVSSVKGVVDVYVHPVLRVVNLLPCQIECELGEISEDGADEVRRVIGPKGRKILSKEHLVIQVGADSKAVGVNPCLKPHISLRLPGYHWSSWHRIVNRLQGSNTWQPIDEEEDWHLNSAKSDSDNADEFKSIVYFERRGAGDPLNLIISVEMGHCPTIRVFAQFWILDKTGFGCRFCDSFSDLLGASPDTETLRRSYLPEAEVHTTLFKEEMSIPGHQWAVGKDGMTLFFSRKEKFALSIEHRRRSIDTKKQSAIKSNWVSPMDVSNVIPKTVFSVDECNGSRKFELAVSVNVCPSIFSRTTLITLYPRYQIVNLLKEVLVVAQDGWQNVQTCIPPNSSVSFHWERKALPPKVRLGHAIRGEKSKILWSNGCIQLDKVGITSMRIPISASDSNNPVVVQAEVRLATKEQSSAVVVVIWTTDNNSNSLYLLRNETTKTIICRQPLHDLEEIEDGNKVLPGCSGQAGAGGAQGFECGADFGPIINAVFGLETKEEFIWVLHPGENISFGFDDPEKGHILEWNCVSNESNEFLKNSANAFVEIDAMGSLSVLPLGNGSEIRCQIGAEHSTKVIEFVEHVNHKGSLNKGNMKKLRRGGKHYEDMLRSNFPDNKFRTIDDEENGYFSIQLSFPGISISIIDNQSSLCYGREIMMAQLDNLMITFAQNLEGYHEMELILYSLQVDNHVKNSIHPVLVFCPKPDIDEPLVHMSAIRRMQAQSKSLAFRYVAIRILDIEIYLDRRTAENVASFIQPLGETQEDQHQDPKAWITDVTQKMEVFHQRGIESTSADVDAIASTANRSRIYIEQLHLHPVRIGLTFTQEWMEWSSGAEGMMIFQFIRGMASIANAPLKFTSFVVCHVFESPESLGRIVAMHYSSQLTKQIFGILGSLVILGAPADFISNVGTGVRDFFYEPINGLVHGPAQFFEGLEAGTQSLARGVFVGVVRGAANVTEVVNSNLAGLTADDQFLDERKAHQRMLTDALSRGEKRLDFQDSLQLACASVARGVRSGAFGIWEQPILYASKHGPIGFVKGIGKALVGAIVKPVVGVGDAAVLVMNHVSDATSDKQIIPKIPKRLRRALPRASREKLFNVRLVPYDDRAAKAQKIVTGGESLDDVYIGHVSIPTHLIIASDQYLLALDKRSREPWRVSWEEISHFAMQDRDKMRITVFGQNGLKSFVFEVNDADDCELFYSLLLMQADKTGNGASISPGNKHDLLHADLEDISKYDIPGIIARQATHVFGRVNNSRKRLSSNTKDEIDVIEQCFSRVRNLSSHSREFLKSLDHEAWGLIDSWGQVFSGLSSRRCIAVSMINGTGFDIQLKSTKLVEGGSPCYSIPTQEFDTEQGVLRPGGVIIIFGWGVVPNLLQAGNVFMTIETNAFVSDLSGCQGRETYIETMPGYEVGFLEKSYDESGWWAKYWLLVKKG
jgi:Vacuolar-sorting-associated 13 protein C-terminal/SHR-binding domain of vacuolar-sorting associated protein 13